TSSGRLPRKFNLKRFLAVRRSWRGSRVACFWVTSFRKKFVGGELTFLVLFLYRMSDAPSIGGSVAPRRSLSGVGPRGHDVRKRKVAVGRLAPRCAILGRKHGRTGCETPRVRHASCWRYGDMAVGGEGAAARPRD